MSQTKKILVSLPDTLLAQIDGYASEEGTSRSEFVRDAMRHYVRERQLKGIREGLKQGYQQMAQINLEIAQMCFEADCEQQHCYEEKLSECED